jgi:hypothetical protein
MKAGRSTKISNDDRNIIRHEPRADKTLVDALESGATSGISSESIKQIWRSAKREARRAQQTSS